MRSSGALTHTCFIILLSGCVLLTSCGNGDTGGGGAADPIPEDTTTTSSTTTTSTSITTTTSTPVSADFGRVTAAFRDAFVDGVRAAVGTQISEGAAISTGPSLQSVVAFRTEDVAECRSVMETRVVVRPDSDVALEWTAEPGSNGQTTCEVASDGVRTIYRICASGFGCDTRILVDSTVFSVDLFEGGATVRALEGSLTVESLDDATPVPEGELTTILFGAAAIETASIQVLSGFETEFLAVRDIEIFAPARPAQALRDVIESFEFSPDGLTAVFRIRPGLFSPEFGPVVAPLFEEVVLDNLVRFPSLFDVTAIDDGTIAMDLLFPGAASGVLEGLAAIEFVFEVEG